MGLITLFSTDAAAVPSFTRQSGMACTACHTTSFGPNLTQIGRDFKLNGYVAGGGKESKIPPVSAMVSGSFTHTDGKQNDESEAAELGFHANNNAALDAVQLFYAGRVWKQLGAYVELAYDGVEDVVELDHTDIRFADRIDFGEDDGQGIVYGISLNNTPTVQDLWNTTPAWSFPFAASALAPSPAASALIEGGLGGQVGGATAYLMWNNLLYAEAGAYASFSNRLQTAMGTQGAQTDGPAPYWRVALQHQLGGHYFQIGTFGLRAQLFPERIHSEGSDSYSDLGVDANYQFLGNMEHIFEFKASYIREDQNLTASKRLGFSGNTHNTLNTLRTNIAYTYDQTYSLNFGYFRINASKDPVIYGSPAGTPDSEGFIAELDYIPFSLHTIDLGFKLLFTGYLIVLAIAYGMALVQIMSTHGTADGKFGLSIKDIVYIYYGHRSGSTFESKLNGSMKNYAPNDERLEIIQWVQEGAEQRDFVPRIKEIFDRHCISLRNVGYAKTIRCDARMRRTELIRYGVKDA